MDPHLLAKSHRLSSSQLVDLLGNSGLPSGHMTLRRPLLLSSSGCELSFNVPGLLHFSGRASVAIGHLTVGLVLLKEVEVGGIHYWCMFKISKFIFLNFKIRNYNV